MYSFEESLHEKLGFDVPSCIAGGFDMRLHPTDGGWNSDLRRTEANAGCHWPGACSALPAPAAEADTLSSSESRE
jgi:hypothetical protein